MYLDPRNPKKQAIYFAIRASIAVGALVVVSVIWHLTSIWRIVHSAHATATVGETQERTYIDRHGAPVAYHVAKLTFVRVQDGTTYSCQIEMRIEMDSKLFAPGQRLDVVPRPDSCWSPLIIGPKSE